jgi:hypothetical protein
VLQVYISNASPVLDLCCKCFIWMLHIFQIYVASVYSKCFIYFRRMLQVCLFGCCSCYAHMLQTYVCKCFTCFRRRLQKYFYVATLIGVGSGRMQMRSPRAYRSHMCGKLSRHVARQQACGTVPTCMHINRHVPCSCMRTYTACRRSSCMRHAGMAVQTQ